MRYVPGKAVVCGGDAPAQAGIVLPHNAGCRTFLFSFP